MHLTPELLLKAYSIGIFPMAESRFDPNLHWIDPDERGILPLNGLHVPRRLKKTIRRGHFDLRCDFAFDRVLQACAEAVDGRQETWINPAIKRLVSELFDMGFAHSVEVWRKGDLVGGLYGISLGGCFFGESMFSRERDASKVALVELVLRLSKGGYQLLDTQFTTPHLEQFGVVEIPREDYRIKLSEAIKCPAEFPIEDISQKERSAFLSGT
jgi:leucyl/phenylalanyl-tRNA--protein transferase